MIIHCFTSIEMSHFDETDISEINASKIYDSKIYKLSRLEICHEEKVDPVRLVERGKVAIFMNSDKLFIVFVIHREGEEERKVRMMAGSIIVKQPVDFKNNIIDLEFAKPKNKRLEIWMKSMRIRNIKNTSIKKVFTTEEKTHYFNYLEEVRQYIKENPGKTNEEAFDEKQMEPLGRKKALYQQMRDFRDAILTFCNPESEGFKDFPENERLIGKIPFTVQEKIHIKSQTEYTNHKKVNKRGWDSLIFETAEGLDTLEIQNFSESFQAINLVILKFINVKFLDTTQNSWDSFATTIQQMHFLKELQISANLEDFPEVVYQKMPQFLETLNLSENNLNHISNKISMLKNLKYFYLDDNQMINEIPWNFLSEGLLELSIQRTSISMIPQEIQRFQNLEFLKLSGTNIEHIPWSCINKDLLLLEIGYVKNFEEFQNYDFHKLQELCVSDNDLKKKLTTKYFPKNLMSLELKSNSIENLCGYFDFTRLNDVNLSNNKLTDFAWWAFLRPMEKVNLSNNEIETLCSPVYWSKFKYLNLSKNKISKIELFDDGDDEDDEDDNVPEGCCRVHLNLSENQLTSLPSGFEKIIQIISLNLSKNKFEYINIDFNLYKRLPKSLQKLNISGMPVCILSCTLCYRMFKEIIASECELRYICPKIHNQFSDMIELNRNLKLNITSNPTLKGFPFVPDSILPYQNKHEKIIKSMLSWQQSDLTKKSVKLLTSPSFQYTQRLAFKMEFEPLENNENKEYYCKCCAKCGIETGRNVIQQIMTMDCELFETTEKEKTLNYWKSETWKSNVVTRLCGSCKTEYQNATKELLESRKRKQIEEKSNAKKQHIEMIKEKQLENIEDEEMPESSSCAMQYYPELNIQIAPQNLYDPDEQMDCSETANFQPFHSFQTEQNAFEASSIMDTTIQYALPPIYTCVNQRPLQFIDEHQQNDYPQYQNPQLLNVYPQYEVQQPEQIDNPQYQVQQQQDSNPQYQVQQPLNVDPQYHLYLNQQQQRSQQLPQQLHFPPPYITPHQTNTPLNYPFDELLYQCPPSNQQHLHLSSEDTLCQPQGASQTINPQPSSSSFDQHDIYVPFNDSQNAQDNTNFFLQQFDYDDLTWL